jgi:hypothetical protein
VGAQKGKKINEQANGLLVQVRVRTWCYEIKLKVEKR